MVFREGVLEIRTSFFKGLSNLGHFRTSRKEGVENGQKIRTSFMDGPLTKKCLKIVPFIIQLKNQSVHFCNIGVKAPNNSIITCSPNNYFKSNVETVYHVSFFLSNVANVDTMILA